MSDNEYSWLARAYLMMEGRTRQVGKTTAFAEACKKINGLYIAASEESARYYKEQFGVDAITYNPSRIIGTTKPIVFDHFMLGMILSGLLETIEKTKCTKTHYRDIASKRSLHNIFRHISNSKNNNLN